MKHMDQKEEKNDKKVAMMKPTDEYGRPIVKPIMPKTK